MKQILIYWGQNSSVKQSDIVLKMVPSNLKAEEICKMNQTADIRPCSYLNSNTASKVQSITSQQDC